MTASEKAYAVEGRLNLLIPGPWSSLGAISGFGTGAGVYHRWRFVPLINSLEFEIEEASAAATATSYTYPNSVTPAAYCPPFTKRAPATIAAVSIPDQTRIIVNTTGTVQIFGLPSASYGGIISAHFTVPLDS